MSKQSREERMKERVSVYNYGDYYDKHYEAVFDKLKTPYSGTRHDALTHVRRQKVVFIGVVSETHSYTIPELVLYMKLLKFINTIKKGLDKDLTPQIGNAKFPHRYIGFCGYMRSGKTTCANLLKDLLYERFITSTISGFAIPLKEMMAEYFGFTYEELYTQHGKKRKNEHWGMSNRKCLQKLGTDALRDNFHPDVWVNIAKFRNKNVDVPIIFDDVRFDNEVEMISNEGLVIRVDRPGCIGNDHASERLITDVDYILTNDGTLEDLKDRVENMYTLLFKDY